MKILVIGGTRFIGPRVVRSLSIMGHEIIVFHRGRTEADLPPGVKHIHGWIQNLLGFADDFKDLVPEVVLYMIPIGEQDSQIVVNTFRNIARRLVAISSQDVYRAYGRLRRTEPGLPNPIPLTEEAPLREKLYPYRSETPRKEDDPQQWLDNYEKILAERIIMSDSQLPGTVLRLPMVYGPNDGGRTFKYLKRMDDGRPVILLDEVEAQWRWSRGYVEDVANAIALAVTDERATGRIYNVAEIEALTEREWVRRIADATGWTGRIVVLPQGHMKLDEDYTQHLVVDTTRIRQELGYRETVSQAEAIQRTIAWQRAHPPQVVKPSEFDYKAEDTMLTSK